MASPIQLIQIGTTVPSMVTCHPRRRRAACRRAIRKKSTAVIREKIRCVMVNIAEKIPSGYLFAEGCDRPVVVLVHPEYCVQICASKYIKLGCRRLHSGFKRETASVL